MHKKLISTIITALLAVVALPICGCSAHEPVTVEIALPSPTAQMPAAQVQPTAAPATPAGTATPENAAETPMATQTPKIDKTPVAADTPKPTQTPKPADTPKPTQTPQDTPAAMPERTATPEPEEITSSGLQRAVDLTNAYREKKGLSSLKVSDELMKAAGIRASEIIVSFSHTRPGGASCFTVSSIARGENIAMGTNMGADLAVSSWIDSPSHRDNILGGYTLIGIGYAESDGNGYWVQLFG